MLTSTTDLGTYCTDDKSNSGDSLTPLQNIVHELEGVLLKDGWITRQNPKTEVKI